MMSGIAKMVALYLAPILMLTSLFLTFFAFFAPAGLLHDRVSLMTVTSVHPDSGVAVDGPAIFMGVVGSCARVKNSSPLKCTALSITPLYNTTSLPSGAPSQLLSPPPKAAPAFLALSLGLSLIFFFTFTTISFRHFLGAKLTASLDRPAVHRFSAWIGVFGLILGLATFLIIRMYFGKAVDDFNNAIETTSKGVLLQAAIANGFPMIYVGYAFYAVPVVVSLTKWHVDAQTKGKA